jgi:hypothetical protein
LETFFAGKTAAFKRSNRGDQGINANVPGHVLMEKSFCNSH